MISSGKTRCDWSATTWLLLFLCISLLGWRYNSRLEQYRPPAAGSSATISIFDANERNYESAHATRQQVRAISEEGDLLDRVARPELPVQPTPRGAFDRPALPSDTSLYSVSLFSNPPPPSFA
jgi:hypothetical protein